jgi:hypothetical protein
LSIFNFCALSGFFLAFFSVAQDLCSNMQAPNTRPENVLSSESMDKFIRYSHLPNEECAAKSGIPVPQVAALRGTERRRNDSIVQKELDIFAQLVETNSSSYASQHAGYSRHVETTNKLIDIYAGM